MGNINIAAVRAMGVSAGFRRIDFVRVLGHGDELEARLVGVGDRLPREVPLPLRIAARLAELGIPIVVDQV